jgi:hypothetical protein
MMAMGNCNTQNAPAGVPAIRRIQKTHVPFYGLNWAQNKLFRSNFRSLFCFLGGKIETRTFNDSGELKREHREEVSKEQLLCEHQ